MERLPELKVPPRHFPPALSKVSNANMYFSIEYVQPPHKQKSLDFGSPSLGRTWRDKDPKQGYQEFKPQFATYDFCGDSQREVGFRSFCGVSHPPEPIDIDLMRPVRVPINQDKLNARSLVRDLSAKGPFLDDLSIQFHGVNKPTFMPLVFSPSDSEGEEPKELGMFSVPCQSQDKQKDRRPDSQEGECIWDASLPSSANASPRSGGADDFSGVLRPVNIVDSYSSAYQSERIFMEEMRSIDRRYEITKGNTLMDSLESAKTSVSRASYSSGLSDDSNWSSLTGSVNKPHKGNDPRWKAILGVRGRDGVLGMSHFRLIKRIGSGDIGTVYLSELNGTPCCFAMKVMEKESLESRNKLIRAHTEREILQLLDHPFLPTLYAHFETEKFSCLVMEYCPGGDLHTLRQRQPGKHFSEYAARFYAAEVLLAIEYLHMLGVVYRDLKPENVLVREDGHIMLSDFDLSLRCSVSPTLVKTSYEFDPSRRGTGGTCIEPTSVCIQPSCFLPQMFSSQKKKAPRKSQGDSGKSSKKLPQVVVEPTAVRSMSFVGTHEYLAPEIIKGEGHGSAVDWWTLGIFLHELLFGRTPFKGSGNRATLFNVVGQQLKIPDSPASSNTSRDLICRLLMKDPQDRLGVKRGAAEIKQHPFFDGVNWALIRCNTPPAVPRPVEAQIPPAFRPVETAPSRVCSSSNNRMAGTNSGGNFLDFEFF